MAVTYTKQMRQVTSDETATNDAISVRLRDLCTSVNNAKVIMGPRFAIALSPKLTSPASTTETVMLRFPPWFVSTGYNRIKFAMSGYLTASGSTTWKLYAMWRYYKGPAALTAALLAGQLPYGVDSVSFTSTTRAIKRNLDLVLFAPPNSMVYLMLTSTDQSGSNACALDTFSATCGLVQAA